MIKNGVFQVVLIAEVLEDAHILTSTWAMKQKANGTKRARVNARGFEQIDGEHYDEDDKAAPVTSDVTIRIVFVLMIMAGWIAHLMDVRGAFPHGLFAPHHKMHMRIPEGFRLFYPPNIVLLLLKTLYGTKQAALQFWRILVAAFTDMNYERSTADACLYFAWTVNGLTLWLSWVDDCLVVGPEAEVFPAKKMLAKKFE